MAKRGGLCLNSYCGAEEKRRKKGKGARVGQESDLATGSQWGDPSPLEEKTVPGRKSTARPRHLVQEQVRVI